MEAATRLGRPFVLNAANSEFRRQVAQLLVDWNTERGLPAGAPVPPEVRAWVRTAVGKRCSRPSTAGRPRTRRSCPGS